MLLYTFTYKEINDITRALIYWGEHEETYQQATDRMLNHTMSLKYTKHFACLKKKKNFDIGMAVFLLDDFLVHDYYGKIQTQLKGCVAVCGDGDLSSFVRDTCLFESVWRCRRAHQLAQ
eukprot:TRINITY_DN4745_c0_g1_i3.p1 TRINITY_DN4745_c0_g1~~TRINITY_DN4745_c0_g1_i3.p1  ORF type:complete len:119 (-),score=18.53 TRINITY_DN4745_c0_g1_i3:58-414(-)